MRDLYARFVLWLLRPALERLAHDFAASELSGPTKLVIQFPAFDLAEDEDTQHITRH